jgi:hypothetical protein
MGRRDFLANAAVVGAGLVIGSSAYRFERFGERA